MAVREQEGRVRHEKGEGELERDDTHATNTFLHTLEPCVYVHTDEDVRSTRRQNVHVLCAEKCACDRVSVCTRQERCARGDAWELARKIHKLTKEDKAAFYSPSEEWILPAASTMNPEGKEFVVDSGASMHMVSKKDLNEAEMETLRDREVRRR